MSVREGHSASLRQPARLRLLRVFNLVAAALTYCVRHAGGLFILTWFACLLESATRLALEWLLFSYPPKMPELLLSGDFEPPTWLTAVVVTPWAAMAWAIALSAMADRHSKRGMIVTPLYPLHWLRFELSPAILTAAIIFSAVNLVDGLLRFAERSLVVLVNSYHAMSDLDFDIWGASIVVIHIAVMAAVMAATYPLAGHVLRAGVFDPARVFRLTCGNRLRLTGIFFLLTVVLGALDRLLAPAKSWLVALVTAPPSWTLKQAILRYLVDFPLSMLMILAFAVTVGIVLDALAGAERAPNPRRATAAP